MESAKKPVVLISMAFTVIALVVVSILSFSLARINKISSIVDYIYEHSGLIIHVDDMIDANVTISSLVNQVHSAKSAEERNYFLLDIENQEVLSAEARDDFNALNKEEIERVLLEEHENLSIIARNIQQEVIAYIIAGDFEKAEHVIHDFYEPAMNKARLKLEELASLMHEENAVMLINTEQVVSSTTKYVLIAGAAALFLIFLIAYYVVLRSMSYIRRITKIAQENKAINAELSLEIADRIRYESALEKSESLEKIIRENVIDAIISIDEVGTVLSCNKATVEMLGYTSNEFIGKNIKVIMPDDISSQHDGFLKKYLDSGKKNIIGAGREVVVMRKDGSQVHVDIGVSEVVLEGERIFVGVLHDITERIRNEEQLVQARIELEDKVRERTQELFTLNKQLENEVEERKQAQEQLQHKATHDSLTGLANRALFYEQLFLIAEQSRRHKHKVALFYIDLDGFKLVNDNLGHDCGDRLLIEVAKRIKNVVRAEDIVARLGGDEFAIIFSHLHEEKHIRQIAEKIISSISQPFENFENSVTISSIGVSIGISVFPFDTENTETLVKCADIAMYQAKQAGKGRYVFYQELKRASSEK